MELRGIVRAALLMAAVLVAGCSKKPTPESVPETQVAAEIDSAETDTVPGTLTDERDGKTYRTVVIGGKRWMAENMNYQPETGNSWCYNNDTSCCKKYGRLYAWNAAMKACPDGYHLPSYKDWDDLVTTAGCRRDGKSKKLKAKCGWYDGGNGTDNYGFSALPGGLYDYSTGTFVRADHSGWWWLATERDSDNAYVQFMFYHIVSVHAYHIDKGKGYSVRCVADAP